MKTLVLTSAVLLTTFSASDTFAQTVSDDRMSSVHTLVTENPEWLHLPAWMGFRWKSSIGDAGGGVWIYFAPTRDGAPTGQPTRPRYVAQKKSVRVGGVARSEWTTTDECPALMQTIRSFEQLETPRIAVIGLRWPPTMPEITLDGTIWTIWAYQTVQSDNVPADITMTSSGGFIEKWGREAIEDLASCWTPAEPAGNF